MIPVIRCIVISCLFYTDSLAQLPDSVPHLEKWMAPAIHITAASASLYALNKTWYADYPSSTFHFTNDMNQWRMMDKAGHAWTAYTLARVSTAIWQQAGMSRRRAVWYGGLSALGYQTLIEGCDGFSSKWGFSLGDMGANLLGTGTYVLQEAVFNKQVVQLKFMSFREVSYPAELRERANTLFGHTLPNRLLNDYNAQTYWASFNIKAILPRTKLPAWLNIAVGYGARNMLGETDNRWVNKNLVTDRSDIPRYSRILISPDIDLTRIKTRHPWLRVLLFMANAIKIPSPTLEYSSRGQWKGYLLMLN